MSDFKKFIDTTGKTIEEIRKNIRDMVNQAVDAAAQNVKFEVTELFSSSSHTKAEKDKDGGVKFIEEKEYKAEKIPPAPARAKYNGSDRKSGFTYPRQGAYPHESVSEDISDDDLAMLNRIKQMRGLEISARGQGVVKRAVELTMLEQGTFMADLEDDFPRRAYCALPQPVYGAMSNSQLRTYFTWRTDARRGRYEMIDKPYVLLYCYELLNKIGAADSVEAFDKLLEVRDGCRSFAPYLEPLMERWLKDFYAFNDVREKYPDINAVLKTRAKSEYEREFSEIDSGNYADKLTFLAENSVYNIKESIFFSEKTEPMLEGACECVLRALDAYFKRHGAELSELICGKFKKSFAWSPFRDAIVNLDTADGFRPVRISASERYCIKRGEPALEMFDFSPMRGFIGYVLKSMEAELRVKSGFNRRLTPKLSMLQNDLKNRTKLLSAVFAPEFKEVIPAAVDEYCAKNGIRPAKKTSSKSFEDETYEYSAAKVEIDVSKLDEIRERAEETAQKLLINEAETDVPFAEAEEITEDYSEAAAAQILDDEFSARIDEYKEELSPRGDETQPIENAAFETLDEDWRVFARSMLPVHISVLKALRDGTARAFFRENGILPETVYEEINTEALSAFGDVVIEHGELVPDYLEDIARLLECAK